MNFLSSRFDCDDKSGLPLPAVLVSPRLERFLGRLKDPIINVFLSRSPFTKRPEFYRCDSRIAGILVVLHRDITQYIDQRLFHKLEKDIYYLRPTEDMTDLHNKEQMIERRLITERVIAEQIRGIAYSDEARAVANAVKDDDLIQQSIAGALTKLDEKNLHEKVHRALGSLATRDAERPAVLKAFDASLTECVERIEVEAQSALVDLKRIATEPKSPV